MVMHKTELKNFAISARRELIEKVALRAKLFGIDEKQGLKIEEQFGQLIVNGETYPLNWRFAFQSLAKQLEIKGYDQLIEEVAYTWFNRIIAIRYMEVHGYLPERVNVLSSSTGKVEPDILTEFESMDLDVDKDQIKRLIREGDTEQAYRKLFIAQCNALHNILPFLFEKINDYTELLLPDYLLDSESIISQLVKNDALTESFEEVEAIGWLYQFYNSEPKEKVLEGLKKNKKISKGSLPYATQLFTPKWIVKYMVENSLGKLWLESYPSSPIEKKMKFLITSKGQSFSKNSSHLILEELKILDPFCGSGNILVYAFDLLYDMYEEAGYPTSDIPKLILENNLIGLDIDKRAAQLANFSLLMKARSKSRSIFKKKIYPKILVIEESNKLPKQALADLLFDSNNNLKRQFIEFLNEFDNAKMFGSLIKTKEYPINDFLSRIKECEKEADFNLINIDLFEFLDNVKSIIDQYNVLNATYDVIITNPPYMGTKGMDKKLSDFVNINYPKSKYDLYACSIERTFQFGHRNTYLALVTPFTWMFLRKYEAFRENIVHNKDLVSLIQLEYNAFEVAMVPVCTFTLINSQKGVTGNFIKLTDFKGSESQPLKTLEAIKNPEVDFRYSLKTIDFAKIPGSPIAYWASANIRKSFVNSKSIFDYTVSASQNVTGNNNKYLRHFWEIDIRNYISNGGKWRFYAKGGGFRKWYGNLIELVDWSPEAREAYRTGHASQIIPEEYWYKKGITWGLITNSKPSFRVLPPEATFDKGGSSIFVKNEEDFSLILGLLNSKVGMLYLEYLAPTLNFPVNDVRKIPVIEPVNKKLINEVVNSSIQISINDWNSFETSWDFERHQLLKYREGSNKLSDAFKNWSAHMESQFAQLKSNEEELNRIFIDAYGLQDELTPDVPDEEVTVRRADRVRDAKSFLSYFVGLVMGRYSLDVEGLAYAGGDWDESKYKTFKPNKYGLILLTDEYYFEDDIIARLREFLSVTFGEETVEENLQWLAESLGMKQNETAEERLRRYFLDEFFKDHCQVYQKRPIYWLVDSGKQKGLRTLIYMHRYQPDTMATIRFEHLQEIQTKYNNEIDAVNLRLTNPNLSATEKRELEKRRERFQKRLEELLEFDKKLAEYANAQIVIDLDDGVKVNYAKFEKVLAKIK
ncbi:BREX-1 system adenine-specific DNA-methyltransferase PglX [Ureibacillus thermosphaericus]|uniref:BREX-1 system adenine-specific DNA-methyltransferase PglX n=1 Tax=Ureibacillus thermosphaericus TaxID=51173 RepID=UPI0030CA09B0